MRLIDLDELLKFPIRIDHCDKENGNENFVLGIECVIEYAEELPTIDAVPVVRCKDCNSYHRPSNWPAEYTKGQCRVMEKRVHPDDFCSFGERRDTDA